MALGNPAIMAALPMMGNLLGSMFGGKGGGSTPMTQDVTQVVSQTQSNAQSVNVGSNVGGSPLDGLSSPFSSVLPSLGTAGNITGATSGFDWSNKWIWIGAAGIVALAYLKKKGKI